MPIDAIPDLPIPTDVNPKRLEYCIGQASSYFQIPELVIKSVYLNERGKVGAVNKNSNGSYDLGPMQINTVNLDELNRNTKRYISPYEVAFDTCINVYAASWFLRTKILEAGDLWTGVGNYHSKTSKYHNRYLEKIYKNYMTLLSNKEKSEKGSD